MTGHFSPRTAIALVVANMVGTGVFTSLGFQLMDITSPFVILLLWVVGGVSALCGALSYAELGARLPRSGGEYNFLAQIYHPAVGFVSGWISLTVGFAAPIALAAMTFEAYLGAVVEVPVRGLLATVLIAALALFHGMSYRQSGGTQVVFTTVKLCFIVCFCVAVMVIGRDTQPLSLLPAAGDGGAILSGAFAVSLIYVNYAYTGWNAATYIIDELDDSHRLPWVLAAGTAVVLVLYLLLNFTFLLAAPMTALAGRIEVGVIAAQHAFGDIGGSFMAVALAVLLVSTVSAMLLAGPRVLAVIGQDYPLFQRLAVTTREGLPRVAIMSLALVAIGFVVTATFESVLLFSGFVLALNTLFAVVGLFVLRYQRGAPESGYRVPGYPLVPLLYIAITTWTLGYILITHPAEALAAIAMIVAGLLLYAVSRRVGAATG